MNDKICIKPGQKLDLVLTEVERQHILDDLNYLDTELEDFIRATPPGQPIPMTLDDLDLLSGCVAADANHTKNKKLAKALDRIFDKITAMLDTYTDEPQPKILKIEDAQKGKMAVSAANIAQWAAKVLVAAEKLGMKTEVVDTFVPGNLERIVLSTLQTVPSKIRKKMRLGETRFTTAEVAGMTMAVAEALTEAQQNQQLGLLMTAQTLRDRLERWITTIDEVKVGKKKSKSSTVYQFKITLLRSSPAIWRRIQVQDCTLDKLHEHLQTAMGWTNSHLHQFVIDGHYYGDPALLEDMGDIEIKDSTTIMLSKLLPSSGKQFRFRYDYDFGDGWDHEILFEGCPEPAKGTKYPLCLEGEQACPPEDVGGFGGYADFLEAIADPNHPEHDNMLEWSGGKFDPEKFSPTQATKAMKKGLPSWRDDDFD